MRKKELYAVYKNDKHIGNCRETNEQKAIELYLIDSGYSKIDLKDVHLKSLYKAVLAEQDIHY
jgi:hypothetical protein